MRIHKNLFRSILLTGLIGAASSCNYTELDINTDPNKPATGSLALLLPVAENATRDAFTAANSSAMGFAGLWSSSDSYNLSNTSFQGTWNAGFQNLQNFEEILKATYCTAIPI